MSHDPFRDVLEALAEEGVPEIDTHFKAWRALDRDGGPDAFLQHLFAEHVIGEGTYKAVHRSGAAHVTGMFDAAQKRRLYTPVGDLGGGAMGRVYVAVESNLNRKVAFKQISRELQRDERLLRRFVAEVQITAQLDHPNIVPVYGLELTPDGSIGYAMKLVDGQTLEDLIADARKRYDGRKKVDEIRERHERLSYFRRACDALHYAHSRRVYHGDLKPTNVMVGSYNEVYVLDWGLARVADQSGLGADESMDVPADGTIAAEGSAVGTPAYMAPEQAKGLLTRLHHKGPAADQYALGLILQELCTLSPAIDGKTTAEVLDRAKDGHRSPFVHYKGRPIPWQLKAIVEKACARHYDRRYADVGELSEDVRRFLHDEPILATPEGAVRKVGRFIGRYRDAMAVVALFLVVMGLMGVIGSFGVLEAVRSAAEQRQTQVTELLAHVASRGHALDREFLQYERLLDALASTAVHALSHGGPGPADPPVYLSTDYDEGRGPPDLVQSSFYRRPISIGYPVFKLAPGVARESVRDTTAKAATLGRQMSATLIRSSRSTSDVRTLLTREGAPIVWVYIGLSTGVHVAYPGHGGYQPEFDPRERPWYQLSQGSHRARWGNPYVDASGHGLMLPCSVGLYDDAAQFLGVAGIDLTFRHVVEHMFASDLPGARHYLLDERARIVIDSGVGLEPFEKAVLDNATHEMPAFPVAEVADDVASRRAGYRFVGDRLYVHTPLEALGWTYLIEGDARALLGAMP